MADYQGEISKAQNSSYQEAADKLFEAMDIISSKRINAIGFDKTLVCTIESVTNAKNGAYRVTDGTSHFQAYADTEQEYTEGQRVYVKIPGGDMNGQKVITGRYITSTENFVPFVSALDSFVDVTGNTINNFDTQFSLKANDTNKSSKVIWEYNAERSLSAEAQKERYDLIETEQNNQIERVMLDEILTTEEKEKQVEAINNFATLRIKYITSDEGYDYLIEEIKGLNIEENKKILLQQDLNAVMAYSGYKGYECLGLSGDFLTAQLDSRTMKGSYGLRLDILGITENGISEYQRYYLDSSEMFGSPYRYISFSKQEVMYDISRYAEIVSMRLVFYQNNDFVLEDGTTIDPTALKVDDIILQSPYIALGFNMESFNEDTIIFDTHDSLMYSSESRPLNRHIYMRWVHKNGDKFYAIDEALETPASAIIHWYRYEIAQNRSDELAGEFWEEIREMSDKYNYTFTPNFKTDTDAFKVIIEIPSRATITQELGANTTLLQLFGELNANLNSEGLRNGINEMIKETDMKVLSENYTLYRNQYIQSTDTTSLNLYDEIYNIIIEERTKTQYYTSDTLLFTNAIRQTEEAVDLVKSLSITVDEGVYEGVYRLYDETYHIVNSTEASKLRKLSAKYSSVITGIDVLDSAEEITWYFPISNTMIQKPTLGKEYTEDDIFTAVSDRTGYMSIKRTGVDSIEPQEPGLKLIETEQLFRIKDHYTQSAANNTIYCVVRKRGRDYEASATLLFGTTGSNGTEATFLLKMYDEATSEEVSALTMGETISIVPELYDFNNKPISIVGDKVSYEWINGIIKEDGDAIVKVGLQDSILSLITNAEIIDECQCYILKAEIPYSIVTGAGEESESRDVNLSAFLPIPVRLDKKYVELEGATRVIYDTTGTNPRYYKSSYKLFGNNLEQFTNIIWEGYSPDFLNTETNDWDVTAENYFPKVSEAGEFKPQKMYYQSNGLFCVNAYDSEELVWTQPVLIIQNRYGSAMLNNWDGDLTIDEKNGTILSAMMGAGVKNEDNSFSGVLMGQIGKAFEGDNIGLYGYHEGAQSFSLDVKGTATLGKSGKGQIRFDGNTGAITSGNYDENNVGMKIDLDDPFLKAYGAAGAFEMDLHAKDEEQVRGKTLLKISGISDYDENNQPIYKPLFNVGTDEYFLQSIDFSDKDYTGVKFNLTKGEFKAYNFNFYAINKIRDDLFSSISLTSGGNPYFKIHHAATEKYEEIPVYKPYAVNIFYYTDTNGVFLLDATDTYTAGRQYYIVKNNVYEPVNVINPELIFAGQKFYSLNEDNLVSGFVPISTYIPGVQYYTEENKNSAVTLLDNTKYAHYKKDTFYIVSEENEFEVDNSENFTAGRIYYTLESPHLVVDEVLDNMYFMSYKDAYNTGNLYRYEAESLILDPYGTYDSTRVYFFDANGERKAEVVPSSYTIFKAGEYYTRYTNPLGEYEYNLAYTYNSNAQYYTVIYDTEGNVISAEPIANMAPSSSVLYSANTFYISEKYSWIKVKESEDYSSSIVYGFLNEEGIYDVSYTILDTDEFIYAPGKYTYIASTQILYALDPSETVTEGQNYYLDALGSYPITIVSDSELIFDPSVVYYRYYEVQGEYILEDVYDSFKTYYYLTNPEADSIEKRIFQEVEVYNPDYEFVENKFYQYIAESDSYQIVNEFRGVSYYEKIEGVQENDLIIMTKNKFELKSHDWSSNKMTGMHFDISGGGGYIEGFGEYTISTGEIKRPKFILDWRKNRNPIDVNNGIFKVKWNGEVICTNIKASGGKIGGWTIAQTGLYQHNVAIYALGNEAGFYAGPGADKVKDLNITTAKIILTENETDKATPVVSDWDVVTDLNDRYFRVDNSGNLYTHTAEIYMLKAQTLYTENLYLNNRKVIWKSKNIVTNLGSDVVSVSKDTITYMTSGVRLMFTDAATPSGGSTRCCYKWSSSYARKSVVTGVSFRQGKQTKTQIVYLGGKDK